MSEKKRTSRAAASAAEVATKQPTEARICAIYCRVSLAEQISNTSLASQQRQCERHAKAEGYAVAESHIYVDGGYGGGEIDRPALTALRQAVASGMVQAVCAADPDRMSRSAAHQVLLLEELREAGVALLFVTMPMDDSPEAKMFLTIRSAVAEFEKTKIALRCAMGRREIAEQGFQNSGKPAYGYVYQRRATGKGGEWVPHPEESKAVQLMFESVDSGLTPREVAAKLTELGIRPREAQRWSKEVIIGILKRRCYIGESSYNKRVATEPDPARRRRPPAPGKSKKTAKRLRDKSEWITLTCPALVSAAVFARVQRKLAANRVTKVGRPSMNYALKSKVRCRECGYSCCGVSNHGRAYYGCVNRRDRTTHARICTTKAVRAYELEMAVFQAVTNCAEPTELARIIAAQVRQTRKAATDATKERKLLWTAIERLRSREARAVSSLLDCELGDALAAIKADLKETQGKRRELERRMETLAPVAEPSVAELERYSAILRDGLDMKECFARFVKQVRVGSDGIEVDIAIPEPDGDSGSDGNRKYGQRHVSDMRPGLRFSVSVAA